MSNLWHRTQEELKDINRWKELYKNFILMLYLKIGSNGWNEIKSYLISYPYPRNYNDYESFLKSVGLGIYNHYTGRYLETNKFCIPTEIAHKLFYSPKESLPEVSELHLLAEEYTNLNTNIRKLPPRPKYGPNGIYESWE